MADLAEVNATSLAITHYTVMEAGSLCVPWDFAVRQLVYIDYFLVNMHL